MATFAIDLISGKVFLFVPEIGGSTGTTSGSTYTEVNTYADLPTPASAYNGKTYVVLTSTGTYVKDRKEAGLYYSNGSIWYRLGDIVSFFDSDNFQIYDTNDNTKGVEFVTSGITGGSFRQLEVQDKDGKIALLSDVNAKVDLSGDTMTGQLSLPELHIQTGTTVTGHSVSSIHWNETDGTLDVHLKNNVNLQLGQEMHVYGIAGEDILNGEVIIPITGVGGFGIYVKAPLSDELPANALSVATQDALSGNTFYATVFGKVRGVDLSAFSNGDALYLDPDNVGQLTNVLPIYPDPRFLIAGVLDNSTGGTMIVAPARDFSPQLNNLQFTDDFFVGTFIDKLTQTVYESGGTVYITIEADVVSGSTDFRVLVGTDDIVSFSAQTIALIAGTEAVPVLNYVSMTALGIQVQTGWFTGDQLDIDGAFAPVATILVQDAANVAIEGVYKHHGWIDRLITDTRGDNVKIAERLRQEDGQWDNGVLPSVVRTAEPLIVDRIDFSNTVGVVYQKNRNTFPIRTTVGDGIFVHVVNGIPNNYVINHIGEITGSSLGVAWANNRRVNFVVWGVSSQNETDCKIMVNTCEATYGNNLDAINDPNNYANYTIPKEYLGTGFLIARITAQYSTGANGTWTMIQTESLLGRTPNTIGGGASGAGGTIAVKNSIERDVDLSYQLVGDELTPTDGKFYGITGTSKGWYEVPPDATKAEAYVGFNLITGDTTIDNTYNGNIIQASGTTGSTGYTITIASGLTLGFSTTIVNYLTTGIITFASQGTLLSRDSAVTMVDQYGGATLFHQGNNIHLLMGDIT